MPFFIPGISKAKRYGINHHKPKQMTDKIIDFEDWLEYTMERSDFPETELREFEEHYQNLLDYEANILHFITFKLNKTIC